MSYTLMMNIHGWFRPLLSLQTKAASSPKPAPLNSTLAELPSIVTPRLMRWAEQAFSIGTTTEMLSTRTRSSAVVTMARTAYEPGTTGPIEVIRPGRPEGRREEARGQGLAVNLFNQKISTIAYAQSAAVVPLILQMIDAGLFVFTCNMRRSPSILGVSPAKNASSARGTGVDDCVGVGSRVDIVGCVGVGAKSEITIITDSVNNYCYVQYYNQS